MIISTQGLTVSPDNTLSEVISAIDENGRQFVLVTDSKEKLLGVVTDGDIRRALLKGATLVSPAAEIMNKAPRTAAARRELEDVMEILRVSEVKHLPLVTEEGIVTGVAVAEPKLRDSQVFSNPVILMAGGKGQRLYPLTKDVPKPMLPVGGTPILGIILERLKAQGFHDVRISVNYLADVIIDYVGDGSKFGLAVTYLHEDSPLGTAGALATQKGLIDFPFIVMNSDLITHVNLPELISFHSKNEAMGTVGLREHVVEIPFGVVTVEDDFVTALTEKPVIRSMVSAGIYALDPAALDLLEVEEYCDMPTLLTRIMETGEKVSGFPIHESWIDVGRPDDLNQARLDAGN